MASSRSGMIESVSRMARMRSTPTAAWAIALVVVARSLTGLKNWLTVYLSYLSKFFKPVKDLSKFCKVLDWLEELAQVRQVDREPADRHRSHQDERCSAPQHYGGTQSNDNGHQRAEQRFHPAGGQSGTHCRLAYFLEFLLLHVLPPKGFDDPHGFQTLLHHGNDFRLLFADLVRRLLHRLLESRYEEQQEGRHRDRDHGEVPVQPEHQAQHGNDGEQVNQNIQGRGRGETLDGLDVGGHHAQKITGQVAVVVAKREALQMMIGAHTQIVGHPLADALGVVVVNVGCDRAEYGNHDERQRRQSRNLQLRAAVQHGTCEMVEPGRHLVAAYNIVDDDLQRPRARQAHGGFDQHGEQNDRKLAAVWTNQLANEANHSVISLFTRRKRRALVWEMRTSTNGFIHRRDGICNRA